MNFVSPTPNNSETVHTDYVDLAVNLAGPAGEAPEQKTFFDYADMYEHFGNEQHYGKEQSESQRNKITEVLKTHQK